jgi:uncharacterized protein
MNPSIFIVDTNVVAAGLITDRSDSPTALLLDAMLTGNLIYLLSTDLLNEYHQVLLRPKLARLHGLQELEVEQIMIELTANAIWRDPPAGRNHQSPDPFDRHLWDLLASDPSAILITGDRLLLENPRPQSSVISPAAWVKTFQHLGGKR